MVTDAEIIAIRIAIKPDPLKLWSETIAFARAIEQRAREEAQQPRNLVLEAR